MDGYIQTKAFLQLMSKITGIPNLQYDPWYFGAGTHENFHSAGLDPHFDFNIHPRTSQHRRMNAIIYLNKDWDPAWGGSNQFHSNPYDVRDDDVTRVEALFNRCAIFETNERSWHSVPVVNLPPDRRHLSRKSFTIYLYTDTRPDEEHAPDHATVYVQRNLPPHIRAGHTLTEEDEQAIFSNIERRNAYLKALYKREYSFSDHIARQKAYIDELRRSSYVPLVGYAKIGEVRSPLFPDRFMETKLAFSMEALRPAMALRLIAYRPEVFEETVDISVAVGSQMATATATGGMFEITVDFLAPLTGMMEVSVTASRAQRPPASTDIRDLSIIVDRIELVH